MQITHHMATLMHHPLSDSDFPGNDHKYWFCTTDPQKAKTWATLHG